MKKKSYLILFAIVLLQLGVPIYGIISRQLVIAYGREFKFKVRPFDPYDAFRGRYVTFSLTKEYESNTLSTATCEKHCYAQLSSDGSNFAQITRLSESKPPSGDYVKLKGDNFNGEFDYPVDRYYLNEKLAPEAEKLISSRRLNSVDRNEHNIYITAKVKNGTMIITGLFVDNQPIEDYLRNKIKALP